MNTVGRYLKGITRRAVRFVFEACLALLSREIERALHLRDDQPKHAGLWLTSDEAALAETLARIIVPSDDDSPGSDEVCVLDTPAIAALDSIISNSPYRKALYSKGLLAFDLWSHREFGYSFTQLSPKDQVTLFRAAQQIYDGWGAPTSGFLRVWRRLQIIPQAKNGSLFAAQLYPLIVSDCLRVFYTSRVSWVWLEYDGPPMDKGYPSVIERRT